MTGAVQKLSAVAVIGLFLAFLVAPHWGFAQDEPEPESSPIETPQAEPTDWVPVTAADAERGGPAPSAAATPASAETSAPAPSSAEAPSPAAPSNPASMESPVTGAFHSTISRERSGKTSPSAAQAVSSAAETPDASSSAGATPPRKAAKGASGAAIVPENSPFAGMNFGNQKGPTNIKSDTLNLDYQNKAILFTGHVHAVQAGGDLTSDTLKVQYGKDFNDIKMMYSDGNVRMSQGTRWITSDHAVLDQDKHLLTFHGNPVVHDGEDQITGSLITVDLVSGKSTVQNPRVVIFPRESKNPDNVTAPDSP